MPVSRAVGDYLGNVPPLAIVIFLIIWSVRALIRELRPLIVQLYALRGVKAHQRGPIIDALARLYPGSFFRKPDPSSDSPALPGEEGDSPPGPDRGS